MGLQISTEYWILWILDIRTSLRFKKCHSEYASNILKSATRHTLLPSLSLSPTTTTIFSNYSPQTSQNQSLEEAPNGLCVGATP